MVLPTLEYLDGEYLKAVPLLTVSEVEEVQPESEGRLALRDEGVKELRPMYVDIAADVSMLKKELKKNG